VVSAIYGTYLKVDSTRRGVACRLSGVDLIDLKANTWWKVTFLRSFRKRLSKTNFLFAKVALESEKLSNISRINQKANCRKLSYLRRLSNETFQYVILFEGHVISSTTFLSIYTCSQIILPGVSSKFTGGYNTPDSVVKEAVKVNRERQRVR